MNMKRRVSGSMTIYFSIIIMAIILLFCILFKMSRIIVMQTGGRQTLDLCASSVMSGYHRTLQERYGLYAIESISTAQEDMEFFLKKNLQLREIRVYEKAVLTDEETYDEQIARYMKYRIIISLVSQYADFLQDLENTQANRDLLQEEMDISGVLQEYNRYFSEFVSMLEGIEENGARKEPSVKGFWNEEWQKNVYETILTEAENDDVLHKGAITSWLERIRMYIPISEEVQTLWENVCREGAKAVQTLQDMRNVSQTESVQQQITAVINEIHTGDVSDQNILESLKQNQEVLKKTKGCLENLLETGEPPYAVDEGRSLLQYTENIYVDYELRSMQEKRSWNDLWDRMQEYVTDLSDHVSDELRVDDTAKAQLPSAALYEDEQDGDIFSLPDSMEAVLDDRDPISLNRFYNVEYLTGLFFNLCEVIQKEEGKDIEDLNGEEKKEGVFEAEVEYVICGKSSDLANCKGVRLRLVAVRMMCNLMHLLTNTEKQTIIRTAANLTGGIIAPGIGNIIMRGVITSVWAAAESYADYEQLIKGNAVPLFKSDRDWVTDLDRVWEENWKNAEDGKEQKGLLYVDYLKILLLLIPENTVERRTQDLIQLNLQKEVGSDIQLKNMLVQFTVNGYYTADGREYTVKGEYGY